MIDIKKYMSKKIVAVSREDSILSAARLMKVNNVSCLLVKDKYKFVGIVTERDITNKCVAEEMDYNTKIEEIMSYPLYTSELEKDIFSLAFLVQKQKIKKIPITKNNEIIGIITDTDLIHAFLEWLETVKQDMDKQKSDIKYSEKTIKLIKNFNKEYENTKVWHMLCEKCGHKFFVEEANGKLINTACPKCGSQKMHHVT